jgi:hypothetical protein
MDFADFDRRRYPTVTPRAGYGEWADTYEVSVPELLDLGILERVRSMGKNRQLAARQRHLADRWCGSNTGNAGARGGEKDLSALAAGFCLWARET